MSICRGCGHEIDWIRTIVGKNNLFRYSAEENLENLEVSIYHDDLYLGV